MQPLDNTQDYERSESHSTPRAPNEFSHFRPMKKRNYERWEVCISNKFNINSYVGYCKAQFLEEKRTYVVVKARGQAIENALKVVQLVKENIGGINSCVRLQMQLTLDKGAMAEQRELEMKRSHTGLSREFMWQQKFEEARGREILITSFEEYQALLKDTKAVYRVMPAIEVTLSQDDS